LVQVVQVEQRALQVLAAATETTLCFQLLHLLQAVAVVVQEQRLETLAVQVVVL
jgi:hypothetical protein